MQNDANENNYTMSLKTDFPQTQSPTKVKLDDYLIPSTRRKLCPNLQLSQIVPLTSL